MRFQLQLGLFSAVDAACAEDLRHLRTRQSATGTPVVDWLVATSECAMYLSQNSVLALHEHERSLRSHATLRDVVDRMRRPAEGVQRAGADECAVATLCACKRWQVTAAVVCACYTHRSDS